jgi:hypothetical protein
MVLTLSLAAYMAASYGHFTAFPDDFGSIGNFSRFGRVSALYQWEIPVYATFPVRPGAGFPDFVPTM